MTAADERGKVKMWGFRLWHPFPAFVIVAGIRALVEVVENPRPGTKWGYALREGRFYCVFLLTVGLKILVAVVFADLLLRPSESYEDALSCEMGVDANYAQGQLTSSFLSLLRPCSVVESRTKYSITIFWHQSGQRHRQKRQWAQRLFLKRVVSWEPAPYNILSLLVVYRFLAMFWNCYTLLHVVFIYGNARLCSFPIPCLPPLSFTTD